eukprot:GEMP01065029.1.p2 GENE.GEMP01065029.1~~GEMP01065029.1.p2  ORF type:complete len:114 (+),score=15.65 GEMP01065029.1:536-877(+)
MHKMSTLDIEKWETWASGLEKSLQSGHTPPTAPIETLGLLGLEPRLRIAIQRGIAALEYLPSVMQKEKHLYAPAAIAPFVIGTAYSGAGRRRAKHYRATSGGISAASQTLYSE